MGETGSYSRERTEDGIVEAEAASFHVPVIDTVGAGDGFAAGVITSILEDLDDTSTLERANAIGGMQVMNLSDNEGLPTPTELGDFMKTYRRQW